MGAFAGLFTGLFASFAGFFTARITQKAALGAAAIATFATLTIAFFAALTVTINAVLSVDSLPSWVLWGFVYFMPSNLPLCVSGVISAHVAAALYQWNTENVRLAAWVT